MIKKSARFLTERRKIGDSIEVFAGRARPSAALVGQKARHLSHNTIALLEPLGSNRFE